MVRAISPFSTVYSILAGPILWFVHFIVVYVLGEFGCRANFNNLIFIAPSTIRILIVLITIVVLAAVAVGGVMGYRNWKTLRESGDTNRETRHHFLAQSGMVFSLLFFFSILMTVAPTFFVQVCDGPI